MLPKWHFLYGYIFSLFLLYFFKIGLFAGLIVFLASVFIDLDHVLLYFIKTKNLHPWKFYSWSMNRRNAWLKMSFNKKEKSKRPHFILHGVEFIIILSFLSVIHSFFLWILLGVSFHLLLDIIELLYRKDHLSVKISQIWLWQRNKNRKESVLK